MKLSVLLLSIVFFASSVAEAQVWVDPYFRKDGTPVPGHLRTPPNNTIRDNYGYPDNYNPNKGIFTPGDPTRRDQDRDGIPDAYDPTPRGTRSRGYK